MRLSGNGQISLERSGTIVKAFREFSAFWGPRKISIAPNQHHPLTDLLEKPGNTAPPLLPSAFSHIHSKTACRGFESFCPCHLYWNKMIPVRKKPGIPGFFRVLRAKIGPSRRDVFE